MKIIYDAMGGDNAPSEIVKGAIRAKNEFNIDVIFSGREELIIEELLANGEKPEDYTIVNATEVIGNDEDPAFALRRKKDSSIVVGMGLLAQGGGDAIISAGSTGALLAAGLFIVKRLEGIKRAPIGAMLPNLKGHSILVDSGANMDTDSELLGQFAYLGYIYMKEVMGIENPRVGLLNVGSEEGKGNALTKETHELLKQNDKINYIGSIEAKDIPFGVTDVIVCDGFAGNVFIKAYEGTSEMVLTAIKSQLQKIDDAELVGNIAHVLKDTYADFDYRATGGAPLLGLNKPVIKAHGSSDALAIFNATRQAISYVKNDVTEKLKENL